MTKIQTTRVYTEVDKAVKQGYTTISAQGGMRSSKTYNILIYLIAYVVSTPKTTLSIVRKTLPSLKKSVLRDFEEIMQTKFCIWDREAYNKTELTYKLPNGSLIEFFSIDNEAKVRGAKRHILYVNEGNELTHLEWMQLEGRTTKFSIIDYNPSYSEDHWLNDLNRDKDTHHFISTYKDNPFLEQKIIDGIEKLQFTNKSLYQIYALGLRSQVEGLIFKNVSEIDEIPYWVKKRWYGLDFGFSKDPTAFILVAIEDNNLYIDEQFYLTKMLTADIIREIKNRERHKVDAESQDPRLIQEISNSGINIHPVNKGKRDNVGSIKAGILKMQEFNIFVTKRSTNVLKEFRNYTYAQNKDGKWLDEPIDDFNHAIDAIRYVVLTEILGNNKKGFTAEFLRTGINR